MDRIKRDTLLGLVFFGTLGFLLWATVNLTDLSLSEKIDVYFPQAGSCDVGTNVMVLGKKVGKVGAIDIEYDRPDTPVKMELLLRESIPLKIGHLIEVRDDGVLGGKQIYIDPGKGTLVAENEDLFGMVAGSAFDKLGDIADGKGAVGKGLDSALGEITQFFTNMNDPETSIGRVTTGRELYDSVLSTFNNANRILEAVMNSEGAIGALIMNRKTSEDTTALLANLKVVSDNLLRSDSPLGVLLNDKQAALNLQDILDNIDQLTQDARQGKGLLGRILTDETMSQEFAATIQNLNTLLAKANDPSAGALGVLTSDPDLALRLQETVGNLALVSEQLTQSKGLLGSLINDPDLAVRFRRILNAVSRAIEDAREAAPISNFIQVLLGTF